MALYNQITFALLMFEMAVFLILIVPLPFTWRRAMFKFISESPIIAKLQFGLKILWIFVAVLFVDALQHMWKVQAEYIQNKDKGVRSDLRTETDWRSRKFLSERNFYLTGFTLFLSVVLGRIYSLILDLIKAQEDLATLKKQVTQSSKGEILAGDIEAKYKKQIADLQKDYDSLSTKYNKLEGASGDKKSN